MGLLQEIFWKPKNDFSRFFAIFRDFSRFWQNGIARKSRFYDTSRFFAILYCLPTFFGRKLRKLQWKCDFEQHHRDENSITEKWRETKLRGKTALLWDLDYNMERITKYTFVFIIIQKHFLSNFPSNKSGKII